MKAWLKGGLIGMLVYFILIFVPINFAGWDWPTSLKYLSLYLGIPWIFINPPSTYTMWVIISVLINFFIIGAIIGFIINKIRRKKKR